MSPESPYAPLLASIPLTVSEVSVLGSRTRYWVYSPADAERTVVIVHGYRGEHHGIEPIIANLPGVRFVSPDLPGFGESTPLTETDHSVAGYSAWLVAFVDALELEAAPIVLGHSFGSIVVSHAVAGGMRPLALILVNPIATSGLKGPRQWLTGLTVFYYGLAKKLPARWGRRLLGSWVIVQLMSSSMAKTKDRALRRWIHREHHTYFSRFASRDVVVEGFAASISADVSEFAAQITVPTLLVAARLDDITPVEAQYDLTEAIAGSTLVVLDDVGHLIHYEVPELAASAITDFLDTLPAS
ncbi:alpha/beta fold hydrolase [Marisediminicola sp. LYQ134]|uniref:alpha/beta fold hydrolase n=1 Tax=Marisediminicola sp. LYQ134 TaxID=3391061 RepID=UPI003983C656